MPQVVLGGRKRAVNLSLLFHSRTYRRNRSTLPTLITNDKRDNTTTYKHETKESHVRNNRQRQQVRRCNYVANRPLNNGTNYLQINLRNTTLNANRVVHRPMRSNARQRTKRGVLAPMNPTNANPCGALRNGGNANTNILQSTTLVVSANTLTGLNNSTLNTNRVRPIFPTMNTRVNLISRTINTKERTTRRLTINIITRLPTLTRRLGIRTTTARNKMTRGKNTLAKRLLRLRTNVITTNILRLCHWGRLHAKILD